MYLEVANLHKQFQTRNGTIVALKDINIHIKKGEFVCAVGASGSGKTTLLRLIAGLDTLTAGEIQVDGVKVTGPGADRGMVFQKYSLYPWMTVADNVGFGLKLRGVPKLKRQQQVSYYLDVVGLTQFAKALPKELSGGMQQRVAIACILVSQPKILLMDEPFGALDAQTKEMMQQFILELWRNTGTTIFMITHDVEEAVFVSQRIYVLTSHPGSIKTELTIDFPIERTYDIKKNCNFKDYKETVLELMRFESGKNVFTVP
ncbi:MAG: ABC transporter ATP-binding protein [Nostoc sp.]|uniref:ABC transporter ATP-binding protein n=1 Tax=Nostoc sp. TaxID=1180 RepID=UPI002FFBC964